MTTQMIEAPNSKENEMMVLGCMLTSESSLKIALDGLDLSDFYCTEHKVVFSTVKSLYMDNKPADIHLIGEELKRRGKLESVGGLAYLTTLVQFAGTSAYVEEYVQELKDYSQLRQLINLGIHVEKEALAKKKPDEIIVDTLEKLKRIERNSSAKEKFPIKFINQFDTNFLLADPPKKPMLLEYSDNEGAPVGFLPKGIVAMLVGAGGIGKTHLLAQLAISVATGTPWLGQFTTTKHCGEGKRGNVFFGLGENQYDDIHRLLYKASKKLRQHQPDILKEDLLSEATKRIAPFSFCGQQAAFIEDGKPSLYFRWLKARLLEVAPAYGWSLIILDPISRLMGVDAEINNAAATQFIALLEELTIDLPGNPTLLFAHHVSKAAIKEPTKQDQTAARGSSALTDGVRWQINFSKKDDETNILQITKSNFTVIPDPIPIKKNKDGFLEQSFNGVVNNLNGKLTNKQELSF